MTTSPPMDLNLMVLAGAVVDHMVFEEGPGEPTPRMLVRVYVEDNDIGPMVIPVMWYRNDDGAAFDQVSALLHPGSRVWCAGGLAHEHNYDTLTFRAEQVCVRDDPDE